MGRADSQARPRHAWAAVTLRVVMTCGARTDEFSTTPPSMALSAGCRVEDGADHLALRMRRGFLMVTLATKPTLDIRGTAAVPPKLYGLLGRGSVRLARRGAVRLVSLVTVNKGGFWP